MLFSKEIRPCCAYCTNSRQVNDKEAVCKKHGIVSLQYRCKRYEYDPTKRVPPEPARLEKDSFSKEDFSLE